MRLFVRTEQDPMSVATSVTGVVRAMEPVAPVDIRTLEDVVGSTIARPRAIAVLVGAFALVALALAAVGVYGVMAYSGAASERRKSASVWRSAQLPASVFGLVLGQRAASRVHRRRRRAGGGRCAHPPDGAAVVRRSNPLDPWTFARHDGGRCWRWRRSRRACLLGAACAWRRSTRCGWTSVR